MFSSILRFCNKWFIIVCVQIEWFIRPNQIRTLSRNYQISSVVTHAEIWAATFTPKTGSLSPLPEDCFFAPNHGQCCLAAQYVSSLPQPSPWWHPVHWQGHRTSGPLPATPGEPEKVWYISQEDPGGAAGQPVDAGHTTCVSWWAGSEVCGEACCMCLHSIRSSLSRHHGEDELIPAAALARSQKILICKVDMQFFKLLQDRVEDQHEVYSLSAFSFTFLARLSTLDLIIIDPKYPFSISRLLGRRLLVSSLVLGSRKCCKTVLMNNWNRRVFEP